MKDLYNENSKTLVKEIKTQLHGKLLRVHVLKDSVLLRSPYYLKLSTNSMQSLSYSWWDFLQNREKQS